MKTNYIELERKIAGSVFLRKDLRQVGEDGTGVLAVCEAVVTILMKVRKVTCPRALVQNAYFIAQS